MNTQTAQRIFFVLVLTALCYVVCVAVVFADKVYFNEDLFVEGEILVQNEREVIIDTSKGLQTIPRKKIVRIQDIEEQKKKQPSQGESRPFTVKEFVQETLPDWFNNAKRTVRQVHMKIMAWVQRNSVYDLALTLEPIQKFKDENQLGFIMSIYSILLFISAVIIRLFQETVLLILSLCGFQIRSKK